MTQAHTGNGVQSRNEAVTAAQHPLLLGGRTYLLSPPTPQDGLTIAAQVRQRMKVRTPLARLVEDPAFSQLSATLQARAVEKAAEIQARGEGEVSQLDAMDALVGDSNVLAFAVWVLARKNHPELTLEDLRPHITDDNRAEVFERWNEASGLAGLEEKNSAGAPGSKTAASTGASTSSD